MARSFQSIQDEMRQLGLQLAQARLNYVRTERDVVARLDALDKDIAEANEQQEKQTPETLRRELDEVKAKLAALTAPANDKETA